jgi:hypothetical protein
MNSAYTASEENRLTAAALAEARRLRALAPAEFWLAAARWACRTTGRLTRGLVHCVPDERRRAPSGEVIE